MKVSIVKSARSVGSVLLVTVLITFIIGVTLASYVALVSNQSKMITRSQMWNQAMTVSEAGIEDGLQFVNTGAGTPNVIGAFTTGYANDGWERSGIVYHLPRRYVDAAHTIYYEVWVTNSGLAPFIRSTSYLPGPSWVNVTNRGRLSRTVVVQAIINTTFPVAMAAIGSIDFKGNGVSTDSYDSNDPNYSTNGRYDPAKRKANGDVATDGTVMNVNNANVAGHVKTGPGGTVGFGPNSSVGDLAWVDAQNKGIEPGWATDDMNVTFNNVVLPTNSWTSATSASPLGLGGPGKAPDGNTYDHVFTSGFDTRLNPGNYTINDNGTVFVGTNVGVNLNITGGNKGSYSPSTIYVAGMTTNELGVAKFYINGPSSMDMTMNFSSQSGRPVSLQFYGMPTLTSIGFNGNGNWSGTLYAPQAVFTLNGGGNDTHDFSGASVTKTVTMTGHFNFHFDESLRQVNSADAYRAISWREM